MTNSRARAGPARSASRCGPPIDGVSPTTRLDQAELRALGGHEQVAGQRDLETPTSGTARARRRPPGTAAPRSRATSSKPRRHSSALSSGLRPLKTLTSTPPVQTLALGAQQQAARRRSAACRIDRVQALVDSRSKRFSGGLGDREDRERAVALECPGTEARSLRSASAAAVDRRPPSPGVPGQSHRVVGVARDHVQMEVEDGLPARRAARVDEVDAVGAERSGHALRQPLGRRARRPRGPRRRSRAGRARARAGSPARGRACRG